MATAPPTASTSQTQPALAEAARPPPPAPPVQVVEGTLWNDRVRSARILSSVRLWGVTAALAVSVMDPSFRASLSYFGAYWAVTVTVAWLVWRMPRLARRSGIGSGLTAGAVA